MFNKKKCLRVGCVSGREGLRCLWRGFGVCDWIEIRFDELKASGVTKEELIQALGRRKRPVLLTLRTRGEGGVYPWKSRERVLDFLDLIEHVDAVDVELVNCKLLGEVLQKAKALKKGIVVSAHSVRRKLTEGRLSRLLEKFQGQEADIYKVAGLVRTERDLSVLVCAMAKYRKNNLAMMGIGPMATRSRLLLPALGSRFVYGWLDQPVAKNQPSIAEISQRLKVMGF